MNWQAKKDICAFKTHEILELVFDDCQNDRGIELAKGILTDNGFDEDFVQDYILRFKSNIK